VLCSLAISSSLQVYFSQSQIPPVSLVSSWCVSYIGPQSKVLESRWVGVRLVTGRPWSVTGRWQVGERSGRSVTGQWLVGDGRWPVGDPLVTGWWPVGDRLIPGRWWVSHSPVTAVSIVWRRRIWLYGYVWLYGSYMYSTF